MNKIIFPRKYMFIIFAFLMITGISISCNAINNTKPKTDPGIALTQVAINVSTNLTLTAASMPHTATVVPPQPTSTRTPIPTLTPLSFYPTATYSNATIESPSLGPLVPLGFTPTADISSCIYRANLEYTDTGEGDRYPLNKEFSKVWRIKNTGSCAWKISYEFFFVKGDLIGARIAYPLTQNLINPNGFADIRIKFKTPNKPGIFTGYWMIRGDNHIFGVGPTGNQLLWIKIEAYRKIP